MAVRSLGGVVDDSGPVQLYVFGSVRAREEAAKSIDAKNPSSMGTTIVDLERSAAHVAARSGDRCLHWRGRASPIGPR
jgi:hypothetical protein